MKVTDAELQTKSRILCSLTGLKVEEFEALLPSFAAAWATFIQETFQQKGRKRAMEAGRKNHLSVLADKLGSPGNRSQTVSCVTDTSMSFWEISEKEYPHFLREGAAKPRPLSKNGDITFLQVPKYSMCQLKGRMWDL